MVALPFQPLVDERGQPLNTTRRPHLSASVIERYLGCGYQYFLERVLRVPAPRLSDFALGTAAHAVCEMSTRTFLETGVHLAFDVAAERFIASFHAEFDAGEPSPRLLREFGTKTVARAKLELQGVMCVRLWRDEVAPTLSGITMIEREIRVPLDGDEFDLLMKLDIVTSLARETGGGGQLDPWATIHDYKFSASDRELDPSPAGWTAGTVYAIGYEYVTGDLPDEIELIRIRRLVRRPKLDRAQTVRTRAQTRAFLSLARRVADGIRENAFPPTRDPWRCSSCDVRRACKFYADQTGRPIDESLLL